VQTEKKRIWPAVTTNFHSGRLAKAIFRPPPSSTPTLVVPSPQLATNWYHPNANGTHARRRSWSLSL